MEALRVYVADGWQVKNLPWVVGVRCMINEKSVSDVLNFLQVPRARRTRMVEDVTTECVKALYALHQIRYQAFRLFKYAQDKRRKLQGDHRRDCSGESKWRHQYR